MRSADELKAFLAAQGVDLGFVQETAEAHTGTALITIANADNTIVVIPGANALVDSRRCRRANVGEGRYCGQPVRDSPARDYRFLQARPSRRRDDDPQSGAGDRRSAPELLDLVDILILNETELGLLGEDRASRQRRSARLIEAAGSLQGRDKIICVTLGRRGVLALIDGKPLIIAGRAVKAVDTTGAGDCFVGAVAASSRRENPSATHWLTPMPRRRSACSGWAQRPRCRRRRRLRRRSRVVPTKVGTHPRL